MFCGRGIRSVWPQHLTSIPGWTTLFSSPFKTISNSEQEAQNGLLLEKVVNRGLNGPFSRDQWVFYHMRLWFLLVFILSKERKKKEKKQRDEERLLSHGPQNIRTGPSAPAAPPLGSFAGGSLSVPIKASSARVRPPGGGGGDWPFFPQAKYGSRRTPSSR